MDININKRLDKLDGEIDAITLLIASEKAEWKGASPEDKPVILKSIEDLNARLEALIAHRRELSLAPAPAPGNNTTLSFDACICQHTIPPPPLFVSAPLV